MTGKSEGSVMGLPLSEGPGPWLSSRITGLWALDQRLELRHERLASLGFVASPLTRLRMLKGLTSLRRDFRREERRDCELCEPSVLASRGWKSELAPEIEGGVLELTSGAGDEVCSCNLELFCPMKLKY